MKFYAVKTNSNFELKCKRLLLEAINESEHSSSFGQVFVPIDENKPKKNTVLMQGYMFVEMEMNEQSWALVKNIERVSGFVGNDKNPRPMTDKEVDSLLGVQKRAMPESFDVGTPVRVTEGPFSGRKGVIEEVHRGKHRATISVELLGRTMPIEFDFSQMEIC